MAEMLLPPEPEPEPEREGEGAVVRMARAVREEAVEQERQQALQLDEVADALREDVCGLWRASGQQADAATTVSFWVDFDDEGDLQGYRVPERGGDFANQVSILIDFELTRLSGGRWQLAFREIFALPRASIDWSCVVRSATLGYTNEALPSLKQGSWTHRQDTAETSGDTWFYAKDHFEATWLSKKEPEPCVYVEDSRSDVTKSAASLVWKVRISELRDDHHGRGDPTFLRYIRAFPTAMDDDGLVDAHRALLRLPVTQPQCTGCHYCNRGLRRKHCDNILAAKTLDRAEMGKMRQKVMGVAPKRLHKPLHELSAWPAKPQDQFPLALFHTSDFGSDGVDAANNSVLDYVRRRDLEDAIGAYRRLPKIRARVPASQDARAFELDPSILSVKIESWHRMAKPDGSEVFVIFNFTIHFEDMEIHHFSERYSSALHKHRLLMETGLEAETAFPAKQWWKDMIDDDDNVLQRGEDLRRYFELVVRSSHILKHEKARSILGYNFPMLQARLMESQHGHWIEHDLKARSATDRSNSAHDWMFVLHQNMNATALQCIVSLDVALFYLSLFASTLSFQLSFQFIATVSSREALTSVYNISAAGDLDFVPRKGAQSARPPGAMAIVVNAIEATGLKTENDDLNFAVLPTMDMGVLHAYDGTVIIDRPVPLQRITPERSASSTNFADNSMRMGVTWQGGMRVLSIRPLEQSVAMLEADQSDAPPPVLVLDLVVRAKVTASAHVILDWDPQEGMIDHWFELKPHANFQQHDDHSQTVDNRHERRNCEHGALRLQILLLYQVATSNRIVDVSAPIVTQVCEQLFKSKSRERAVVEQLNQAISKDFEGSSLIGFLQVKLCRARQLPSIASDPRVYCTAELENQLYLTSTVTSKTPEWGHVVCFGVTDVSSVLHIRVLQRHAGNHDHEELYGTVDIVPFEFVGDQHTATAFHRWYPVSNRDIDDTSGQIELKFYYAPKQQDSLIVADAFEDTASQIALRRCTKVLHELSQRTKQMEDSNETLRFLMDGLRAHRSDLDSQRLAEQMVQDPIGCLRLAIVKGKDMKPMDDGGASDPYCIVRYAQCPDERTQSCHQTLEPNWDHGDGSHEFIFDVHSLKSTVNIQVWDEDEEDADDFMDEWQIPIAELTPGEINEKWYACRDYGGRPESDAQLQIQIGLSVGSQRADERRQLEDIARNTKELSNAPDHYRCSRDQAKMLLEKTKAAEASLHTQRDLAIQETKDMKRQLAAQLKDFNATKQKLSQRRLDKAKKLRQHQQEKEQLEDAVNAWNKEGDQDDDDDDGCYASACGFCAIPDECVPTLVRVCYGFYFAIGVATLILGWVVHKKVGYIIPVFTIGVAGSGLCMVIIGALVLFCAGKYDKASGWLILQYLNVLQLVMLSFVASDAGLQANGTSNQVLPLVKDWWGIGDGHPSHTLGQNLQCIMAVQDSSASGDMLGTAMPAFELVIEAQCGASIQHRMDMYGPQGKAPTYGFQCREMAREACSEWESEFLEAATTSCSDAQYSSESDCVTNGQEWTTTVKYAAATGNDASFLDAGGGTCLPSSVGTGLDAQACSQLTGASWNVGTCSDGTIQNSTACDAAGETWSVPVTTDTFKYGTEYAFQAVSTNCDMINTPYLKELCTGCSHKCMFARSMHLQAGFAVGALLLIVTYLAALCAAGYNQHLLAAEHKSVEMLKRAERCHYAVALLSVAAVALILIGHFDITRACGLVQPANPNALEITGLQVSVEEGLYDPNGDDDPATGVSCSATIPLVVTLTSSAGLMLATFVNVTAIRRVYRYLLYLATVLLIAAAGITSLLATFYGIETGALEDIETALFNQFGEAAFGSTLEEVYGLDSATCTDLASCLEEADSQGVDIMADLAAAMFFTSRACIPAIIAIAIACCAARRASNYNPAEDDLQLPEF